MTKTSDLHVVLGASGSAGSAVATALHEAGHRVRAVNRGGNANVPRDVERRAADVTGADDLEHALAGASVVYMAAQPPYHRWPELFPPMLDGVIEAAATAGAKLVMIDNLYGYGPGPQPMTEDMEERAADAKGAARREMTEMLLDAHRSGRVRVVIGRASDYFGPGLDNSTLSALAIAPALSAKGTLRWMGSLDVPHSVAYMPDVARAYVLLGTDQRAEGEVWHVPHMPAVTGREFLDAINRRLDHPRKLRVVGRSLLRIAAPFHRLSKESLGVLYQWTDPFIVDSTKFEKAFGSSEVASLDGAIAATLGSAG